MNTRKERYEKMLNKHKAGIDSALPQIDKIKIPFGERNS